MTGSKLFRRMSATVFAIGFTTALGYGQITGGLRGTVSDPSGAVVPKARVTLTNLETRQARTQLANDAGEFSFELLPIGNYEVKAEATGFAVSATQAEVRTGEVASVAFKVEVGQVSQTVDVTTAVSRVDTENAQLQTSVIGQAIQEIPAGWNQNFFALTAPGVVPVPGVTTQGNTNPFLGS